MIKDDQPINLGSSGSGIDVRLYLETGARSLGGSRNRKRHKGMGRAVRAHYFKTRCGNPQRSSNILNPLVYLGCKSDIMVPVRVWFGAGRVFMAASEIGEEIDKVMTEV